MDPYRDQFNPLDMGDQESGIDLAFDMSVIMNGTLDDYDNMFGGQSELNEPEALTSLITPPATTLSGSFYQLKSKPVKDDSSPSQGSCKGVLARSRTNFKQELMREQIVQQEKRQAELKAQQQNSKQNIQQSASVPFQAHLPSVDVPPQVLQVRTRLENPTYYHLKHSQQRQLRQFLNDSAAGSVPHSPVSSPVTGLAPHLQNRIHTNGPFATSAPPTLLNSTPSGTSSPGLDHQSSLATSLNSIGSEAEVEADLVEDILSLEADRRPNSKFFPSTHKTLSGETIPALGFGSGLELQENSSYLENSAPVSPAEHHVRQAQAKDRQKKDNHNMIERRRRFNINDRIKELGTLLPRSQQDPYFDQVGEFRPNKGTILKASVDYIKLLRGDTEKVKPLEAELRKSEMEIRRQTLRIQELEKLIQMNGLLSDSGVTSWKSNTSAGSVDVLADFIKTEVIIKKEPEMLNHCDGGILVLDDLMEDDNTVMHAADPMLTQALDETPTQQLNDSMDFF